MKAFPIFATALSSDDEYEVHIINFNPKEIMKGDKL
jgi:hypothetical protein